MLYPKPFLKWVGGKTQIINQVLDEFPRNINNYYEPFLGGGSVLIAMLTMVKNKTITVHNNIYASDKNKYLIYVYKNIQSKPNKVIHHLAKLRNTYLSLPENIGQKNQETANSKSKESYYYWIRKQYNKMSDNDKVSCKGSAYFIFLNKTCFRGLYRESVNGFNVSYGNYKNPSIFDEDHIKYVSDLIKNVKFFYSSFEYVIKVVKQHDFVYFDPPYVREKPSSFTGYVYDDSKEEDINNKLFNICRDLYNKKILFLMSNSNTLAVKHHFMNSHYKIRVLKCNRNINSKKPNSTTKEVLITWK